MSTYEKKQTTSAPSQFDASASSELLGQKIKTIDKQQENTIKLAEKTLSNNVELAMDAVSSKAYNENISNPEALNTVLTEERDTFLNSLPEGQVKEKFALKSGKKQIYYVDKAMDNLQVNTVRGNRDSITNLNGQSYTTVAKTGGSAMFGNTGALAGNAFEKQEVITRSQMKDDTSGKPLFTKGQQSQMMKNYDKALYNGYTAEVNDKISNGEGEEVVSEMNHFNSNRKEMEDKYDLTTSEYNKYSKYNKQKVSDIERGLNKEAMDKAENFDILYEDININSKEEIEDPRYDTVDEIAKLASMIQDNPRAYADGARAGRANKVILALYKMGSSEKLKKANSIWNTDTLEMSSRSSNDYTKNLGNNEADQEALAATLNFEIVNELNSRDIPLDSTSVADKRNTKEVINEVSVDFLSRVYGQDLTIEQIQNNDIMEGKRLVLERTQFFDKKTPDSLLKPEQIKKGKYLNTTFKGGF